jgi:hypothetical protein
MCVYVCELNENRNLPKNLCETPVRRCTNICSVKVVAIHADSSYWSSNVQRIVQYMKWKISEKHGKTADFHQSPNNLLGVSMWAELRSWTVAIDIWYTIFIYCNWVSTWWQWSVNLYKHKRQLYTKGETIHKTIRKHTIHNMENKHTKQENEHKMDVK